MSALIRWPISAETYEKIALAAYPNATDIAWVQEEPANQGAWSFIALNLTEHLTDIRLRRISRQAAAAPAVGSAKMHDVEQAAQYILKGTGQSVHRIGQGEDIAFAVT